MSSQISPMTHAATSTTFTTARPAFTSTVFSEVQRLSRRVFLGSGVALVAGLTLLVTVITFVGASNTSEGDGWDLMTSQLEAADGLVATVGSSADLLGIVVLSLAAVAVASDYGTGLIRLLVQAEPRRWRLLLGKLVALAGLTVGAAALATVVGVAVSPVLAATTGISTEAWTDGLPGTVGSTFVNLALGLSVWATIGFTFAVATRSVAVAIAGGIGYVLVLENLLRLVSQEIVSWLPGSTIAALIAGGNDTRSYGAALALSASYMVLGAVISLALFQRRDIMA